MAKVTILVGVSGSGKSTWAVKQQENEKQNKEFVTIVSADNYFIDENGDYKFDPVKLSEAHSSSLRHFILASREANDASGARGVGDFVHIIVDNTNTTVTEIAPYYQIALAYSHNVNLLWVPCPVSVAFDRQKHGLTLDKVQAQQDRINKLFSVNSNTGKIYIPAVPWWQVKICD